MAEGFLVNDEWSMVNWSWFSSMKRETTNERVAVSNHGRLAC